jgi:hypothetical protein
MFPMRVRGEAIQAMGFVSQTSSMGELAELDRGNSESLGIARGDEASLDGSHLE